MDEKSQTYLIYSAAQGCPWNVSLKYLIFLENLAIILHIHFLLRLKACIYNNFSPWVFSLADFVLITYQKFH